jgi:GT2 family glycosyltransferase
MNSETTSNSRGERLQPVADSGASPAVSVIVPAYNTARFIAEALQSVFAQTFRDYEVIIVNDGSPDTEDLRAAIAPYRGRIVYIEQENRGPSGARNTGIRAARAELVAFLDSDDCWLPTLLEEQLALLRQEPPADLVYSDAVVFGESVSGAPTSMQRYPSEGPVTFQSVLTERCGVIMQTVVARKHALIQAGLFDESFRTVEDFDLWLRLAHTGARIRYQRRVLARYRLRPDSLTSSRPRMYRNLVQVLEKVARTLELTPTARGLLAQRLERAHAFLDLTEGEQYLFQRQFAEASRCLERANMFFRSPKLRATLLGLRLAPRLTARGVQWYKKREKRA